VASRPSLPGGSARGARSASRAWTTPLSHGITYGIWGGLAERERRALRSRRVGDERRERDAAIAAAAAAGYSHTAIGRAFGLTRTSVSRVLSGGADEREWP